jgi:phage-related holin
MLWSSIKFSPALVDIRRKEGKQLAVAFHYILNKMIAIVDYLPRLGLKI